MGKREGVGRRRMRRGRRRTDLSEFGCTANVCFDQPRVEFF